MTAGSHLTYTHSRDTVSYRCRRKRTFPGTWIGNPGSSDTPFRSRKPWCFANTADSSLVTDWMKVSECVCDWMKRLVARSCLCSLDFVIFVWLDWVCLMRDSCRRIFFFSINKCCRMTRGANRVMQLFTVASASAVNVWIWVGECVLCVRQKEEEVGRGLGEICFALLCECLIRGDRWWCHKDTNGTKMHRRNNIQVYLIEGRERKSRWAFALTSLELWSEARNVSSSDWDLLSFLSLSRSRDERDSFFLFTAEPLPCDQRMKVKCL